MANPAKDVPTILMSQALHLGRVAVGIFLATCVRRLEIQVVPGEAHELEAFEIGRLLDRNGFTVNVCDTSWEGRQVPGGGADAVGGADGGGADASDS